MNNLERLRRSKLPFYSTDDIRQILGLSVEATTVFCSRAVVRGDLVRIKRGLYLLHNFGEYMMREGFFRLANFLQTPSYISLLTALSYYEISTQFPVARYESINPLRSLDYEALGYAFIFFQTSKKYYFGFQRADGFFIAEPEKAIIDAAHLIAFGKYAIDLNALDFGKFNHDKLEVYAEAYPKRTKNLLIRWRRQYGRA